ncbi:MAG: hypothetical protein ACM3PP_10000 [Candidatus Saccharibacteria bacterium]
MNKKKRLTPKQIQQRWIIAIIVVGVLAGTSALFGVYQPRVRNENVPTVKDFKAMEYIPLQKGNYWLYTYERRTASEGGKVDKTSGRIRMEVKRTYQDSGYFLAVVQGDPLSCDSKATVGYLVSSNKVFNIPADQLKEFEAAARSKSDLPMDRLTSENNPILELPLFEGQRWGLNQYMARSDGKYTWIVTRQRYEVLGSDERAPVAKCYDLEYKTTGDRQTLTFAPAMGILSTGYKHFGTTDEFEVNLIGIHLE